MLITAQIPRNVSIVTDWRKGARRIFYTFRAKYRPIILFDSRARALIIPYKVIFVIRFPREGNSAGKQHLESPHGP